MVRTILGVALVALGALAVSAQDAAPLTFTPLSMEPVIEHSADRQAWDGTYTDPGAVTFYDGLFHIFRNGFRGWPAAVSIEHLTSPDALTWTPDPAGPIIASSDVPYSGLAALASGVIVEDDGTWVLYFYTWEKNSSQAPGQIGRATAPAASGPWTIDAEPVLNPGAEGAWDELRVMAPRVIKTDTGYEMYYGGVGKQQEAWMSIGRATSPDGIVWTKYDDPMTTDALYAGSDPVLTSAPENVQNNRPNVFKTADGYIMFYRTFPARSGDSLMTIKASTSPDGISWTPLQDEPLFARDTITPASPFWWTAAAERDGTYYLFIEKADNGTNIFAATLTLPAMDSADGM